MKRHPITRTRHADAALTGPADATIGSRPSRRRALIAATAAMGGLLVASVASSPRPSATAAPVAAVMTEAASQADTSPGRAATPTHCADPAASLVSGPAARCSSVAYLAGPTSPLPPSPCRSLIFGAAHLLGGDPTSWVVSLIDGGGQLGQTIDQAIHDRLDMVRTLIRRSNSQADPQRTIDLESLNALIAEAASQPCSSTACSTDEHAAIDAGVTPTSAGWYWLCESPSGAGTN